MLRFLIIRAPPRDIEFPERSVSSATKGCDDNQPEMGPCRHVLDEVWATQPGE
jgi:hypothetical protein